MRRFKITKYKAKALRYEVSSEHPSWPDQWRHECFTWTYWGARRRAQKLMDYMTVLNEEIIE